MLYNAVDGGWVQLQCPFCAAVQCAIVDSDIPRLRTYDPSECHINSKIELIHDERRSETRLQPWMQRIPRPSAEGRSMMVVQSRKEDPRWRSRRVRDEPAPRDVLR